MLKRLMVTTAIVAIATSAYAAGNQSNTSAAMKKMPSADHYVTNVGAGDLLATTLIGQTVYSGTVNGAMAPKAGVKPQASSNDQTQPTNKTDSASMPNDGMAQDGQQIGDINNLVVAQDGSIDAVIIGVGGFLGMGEKNVAVPFASLQWSTDSNGKTVAYLAATKEQLTNAPNFDVSTLQNNANGQNQQAMTNGTAANPSTTAPAGQDVQANNRDYGNTAAVDVTQISANDLVNTTVYDTDNQNVGNVGDVIVSQDGKIDAIVVDVGGFLGIGEKPVAIAFEDLNIRKDQNGKLTAYTTFSKDQLDNAPKYDKDAYQNQRDSMRLHTQG